MEVAPKCTQKLKVGRKMVWIWKLSSFLVFVNFSKIFKKFWILENSREISLLDLDLEAFSFHFSLLEKSESDFYFTFHFSKRVNQIFISLFTSRKEWIRFSFHFSLLEKSETDFHFTFHFSNFQYPLSQDTAMAKVQLACFRISFISPKPYLSVLESHLRIINPDPD